MNSVVAIKPPWLEMRFSQPMRVLSWVLNTPGYVMADRILWREVCNADLPPDLDVNAWLSNELHLQGAQGVPCFLTSRNITRFVECSRTVEGVNANAVVTLGLSNGERVGTRLDYTGRDWGTINIAVECGLGLTDTAMLEALSIITQARTAALIDFGPRLSTGQLTGTGTDCIALACPQETTNFSGLHTPQAEAIGRVVYDAISQATQDWMEENKNEIGNTVTKFTYR